MRGKWRGNGCISPSSRVLAPDPGTKIFRSQYESPRFILYMQIQNLHLALFQICCRADQKNSIQLRFERQGYAYECCGPIPDSTFFGRHPTFFLVKAAVNALCICKVCKDSLTGIGHGANCDNKTPPFLYFPIAKAGTRTIAHMPIAEGLSFSYLQQIFTIVNCRMKKKDLIYVRSELHRQHLNWLPNWQLKTWRR